MKGPIALTAVLALSFAATALALKPKEGHYAEGGHEGSHKSVTFTYTDGKVIGFFASIASCKDGEPAIITKKVKVKNSGGFGYDGKATSLVNRHFHVEMEGEFVSKRKAEGTVDREDCKPMDFSVKFRGAAG